MTTRTEKLNTAKALQDVFFSDFTTNFKKHPNTGDVARVTNEESVKQSIKNIVMTNRGERLFQPNLGGNIRSYLFEPIDAFTANFLSESIKQTIFNNEMRVEYLTVDLVPDEDNNAYNAYISFSIHSKPDIINIELILKRLR